MDKLFIESFDIEDYTVARKVDRQWTVRVEDDDPVWIRNYYRSTWAYNRSDSEFNPSVMDRNGKCSRLVRKRWDSSLNKWLTLEVIATSWDVKDRLDFHIN